jgi:hypothetical protein
MLSEGTRRAIAAALLQAGHDAAARVLDDCEPRSMFIVPSYVARMAGSEHADSLHDDVVHAATLADERGRPVVIIVEPRRRHDDSYEWSPPQLVPEVHEPVEKGTSVGLSVSPESQRSLSRHFDRAREAVDRMRPDAEDEAFMDAERLRRAQATTAHTEPTAVAHLRRPSHGGHPDPGYPIGGGEVA